MQVSHDFFFLLEILGHLKFKTTTSITTSITDIKFRATLPPKRYSWKQLLTARALLQSLHAAPVTRQANPNGCLRLYRGKLMWIFCILSSLCINTTWHHMLETWSQKLEREENVKGVVLYLHRYVLLKHTKWYKTATKKPLWQLRQKMIIRQMPLFEGFVPMSHKDAISDKM